MSKKYVIYKTDLKYKNMRDIDVNKVDWTQNNIQHLLNTDHDTLQYRINEFNNKNTDLDFEMLNLETIPKILRSDIFMNLKHLFLSNNKLENCIDLSFFKNIETIDITNNSISKILLPESLIELCACNNLISEFVVNTKLKRLKISNNKLINLNLPIGLEILECNNNQITQFDLRNNTNLKRLICHTNPLKILHLANNIIYADLSETLIESINNFYKLEHLVLNNCKNIKSLPLSDIIKKIELIGTPIEKLYFYKNFELILTQLNLTKNISSKYKQSNANIQIRKNIYLVISKNIHIFE